MGVGWRREKGGKGEDARLAREVLWGWVDSKRKEPTMKMTEKSKRIEKEIKERIPRRYVEPDPAKRIHVEGKNYEALKAVPEQRRGDITAVELWFAEDIAGCMEHVVRLPNLRYLRFFDCYMGDRSGIEAYRGIGELKNLDTLDIRDSKPIDAATFKEIASLPRLRSLIICLQRGVEVSALGELAGCKALEYLKLGLDGPEVFAEDLAFLPQMERLRWLVLDWCDRIDVTALAFPKSLEAFTPPSYGYRAAKKVVPDGCVVLKSGIIHGSMRNRFVPPQRKEEEALRRKAAREAARIVPRALGKVEAAVQALAENLPVVGYRDEGLEGALQKLEAFCKKAAAKKKDGGQGGLL